MRIVLLRLWLLLLIILSAIFIAACTSERSGTADVKTIRIGVLYPFSGSDAATMGDIRAGVELAAEVVNLGYDLPMPLAREMGLPGLGGKSIELVIRDSGTDPHLVARQVEELVNNDNVVAIIGCYNSTLTAAASEQAEIMKIPFLNADSSSPTLTQRGLRWFFRTTPDDDAFTLNFFEFLTDLQKQKSISIPKRLVIVHENKLWGTSVARAERRLAAKYGYQVVESISYDATSTDVGAQLQRIKAAMPAIIMQASYTSDAIRFMQGYRRNKIGMTALLAMDAGFISTPFLETAGREAESVLSREVWARDIADKKVSAKAVNDQFRQRYGKNMTGNSARAFTGVIVLADAINRARSITNNDIRKALLATNLSRDDLIMPWNGVRFDQEIGQNILGSGIMVQLQDGEYRTVWPWSLASRPVVWPMAGQPRSAGK